MVDKLRRYRQVGRVDFQSLSLASLNTLGRKEFRRTVECVAASVLIGKVVAVDIHLRSTILALRLCTGEGEENGKYE